MKAALFMVLLAAGSSEGAAKRSFKAGRTALVSGRFAEARDHFRQSLKLVPKAASAFNLGVALRGTGEAVESVGIFESLLAKKYGPLSKQQKEQTRALLEETKKQVAVINVELQGAPQAELRIDGARVGQVKQGEIWRKVIDPGMHIFTLSEDRFETDEQRLILPRGASHQLKVRLEVARVPSILIVEGETDDIVRIVGVGEGPAPLKREVEPGRYRVEAQGPSGERLTDVVVERGQTLKVRLEKDDSVLASPWLWTGVAAVVAGAAVTTFLVVRDRTADPIVDPTYGVISAIHRGP